MAVINHKKYDTGITNIEHYIWENLTNGDEGLSFKFAKPTDKTYHIFGPFGGGVATLYGSNDLRAEPNHPDYASSEWFVLTNTKTDNIALSNNGGGVISENPLYMKCDLAGGTGGSVTISIVAKKVF